MRKNALNIFTYTLTHSTRRATIVARAQSSRNSEGHYSGRAQSSRNSEGHYSGRGNVINVIVFFQPFLIVC